MSDTATDGDDPTRVAIACQGGGSHTAFTAGVLKGLLREWDDEYELVGISGTSGGAFNALAAWYGLVTAGEDRESSNASTSGSTKGTCPKASFRRPKFTAFRWAGRTTVRRKSTGVRRSFGN